MLKDKLRRSRVANDKRRAVGEMQMITVVDYGGGNIGSIRNALDFIRAKYVVTHSARKLEEAQKILFPGVGNFGDVMKRLETRGLSSVIKAKIKENTPFLGICIGLQVLFETSQEAPGTKGLGLLKGSVERLKHEKVPQVGWNRIHFKKKSKLLTGVPDKSFVYFVNSYYAKPQDNNIVLTTTNHGTAFASSVENENIFATQFHPEKSGKIGLRILKNFMKL